MAIFPGIKPYCEAHKFEISIRFQRMVATMDRPQQRVHTATKRSWLKLQVIDPQDLINAQNCKEFGLQRG